MKLTTLASVATVLFVASLVRADAPTDQYALFSGTDTTITDNFTGLTWDRSFTPGVTFLGAQTSCPGKRVPTVKELLTLVDEQPHLEFQMGATLPRWIDQNAFGGTPVDKPFWTITPQAKAAVVTKAFAVDFGTGTVVELNAMAGGDTAYIRCVK